MKVKGNQVLGLIRQTGDTADQLDDGTMEAQVRYVCRWANVLVLAPRRNVARHPDFPTLICKSCKVSRLKPGLVCELTVVYRGLIGPEETDPDELDNATEEIISSTSEAPIETHPKFKTHLGGTKANALNGAVFDADGKFVGWKGDSVYAGVESYLIPSTVYRKTTPTRTRPSTIGPVGTIQSPGIGGGPTGANWLFTSTSWRRDGGVYEVTKEYMLSGSGGWNTVIYDT